MQHITTECFRRHFRSFPKLWQRSSDTQNVSEDISEASLIVTMLLRHVECFRRYFRNFPEFWQCSWDTQNVSEDISEASLNCDNASETRRMFQKIFHKLPWILTMFLRHAECFRKHFKSFLKLWQCSWDTQNVSEDISETSLNFDNVPETRRMFQEKFQKQF